VNAKELKELDAWIAENLFTWTNCRDGYGDEVRYGGTESEQAVNLPFPHYTTDPVAAMSVLKKCLNRTNYFTVGCDDGFFKIEASYIDGGIVVTQAETIPLAICLFAKKLFAK
jgi:hypothetical protein